VPNACRSCRANAATLSAWWLIPCTAAAVVSRPDERGGEGGEGEGKEENEPKTGNPEKLLTTTGNTTTSIWDRCFLSAPPLP
jgi:hypothetical protein